MKLALRAMLPALLSCSLATAAPMKLADYLALTGPAPTAKIAYGSAPSQYAELFRPAGDGPFPVVVLVHGGCWTIQFGGIGQMRNLAGALAAQGIAVWNVEYRRVDEEGGGYPGTYQTSTPRSTCLARKRPPTGSTSAASSRSGTRPAANWCSGSPGAAGSRPRARFTRPGRCRCARSSAWAGWPTCATSAR